MFILIMLTYYYILLDQSEDLPTRPTGNHIRSNPATDQTKHKEDQAEHHLESPNTNHPTIQAKTALKLDKTEA